MKGRIGLVDRARMSGNGRMGGGASSYMGNGNGGRQANLTSAQRDRIRQDPQADAIFNAVARRTDRFGDDVSDLKTQLDEPMWSRLEFATGAPIGPDFTYFAAPTGDGIDQSRFINNRQLEGSLAFKILAVAFAVQGRIGQSNFDLLQFNASLFGSVANETVFNFPLEAGMMQRTEEASFAADASAGPVRLESVTGINEFGWIMSANRNLYWPSNVQMTWTLRFNAAPTFATPPDTTPNFVTSLVLYGYKSQDMVG